MEEGVLFDRIHEALDVGLPSGAYERLRTALTTKPVRPYRWPAFQTRWTKMGFKLAAGVALIALVAATAAAVIAIHNASVNSSPAGSRMSVSAYQALMASAYVDPTTTWTSPCAETVHTGCLADATRSVPLLQRQLERLDRAAPPSRFTIVDVELKQHLRQSIAGLVAMETDARTQNSAAVTRDYVLGSYGADWVMVIVPAIEASHVVTAATYAEVVRSNTTTLDNCGAACGFTPILSNCLTGSGLSCSDYFLQVAVSFADYQANLIEYAAPPSLAAADANLQSDLAKADSVLLTTNLALAANDQNGINAGFTQLAGLVRQIDHDAQAILNT